MEDKINWEYIAKERTETIRKLRQENEWLKLTIQSQEDTIKTLQSKEPAKTFMKLMEKRLKEMINQTE